jgi:hypothetical protein
MRGSSLNSGGAAVLRFSATASAFAVLNGAARTPPISPDPSFENRRTEIRARFSKRKNARIFSHGNSPQFPYATLGLCPHCNTNKFGSNLFIYTHITITNEISWYTLRCKGTKGENLENVQVPRGRFFTSSTCINKGKYTATKSK